MRTFDAALFIGAGLLAALVAWRLIAMLGILDRQRYWAFFKAYVICYVSLWIGNVLMAVLAGLVLPPVIRH